MAHAGGEGRRSVLAGLTAIVAGGGWWARSARGDVARGTDVSVADFGAIGDGRSHPLSEWVPGRYADLAAIRADYPDARSLADEIDFVAINKAVRVAAARGAAVLLPAGTYQAWVYVRTGSIALVGAGASVCRLQLPDGALHRIRGEDGRMLEGTPCVIEAGAIGDGNRAAPLRGLRLSGVTLDGNRAGTRAPRGTREDVFGWGLAFTNFSDARYADVVAVNCHAGGIGTFITSNSHVGEARVERCGAALGHPGFDVNSSHDGRWTVAVRNCPYGVRLLDNCWNCTVDARIDDAELAGLVCDNQRINQSHANAITAIIRAGCKNAGAQIGDGWTRSTFDLRVADVDGVGVNSVGPLEGSRGESGNRFTVATSGCGAQGTVIGGSRGEWRIDSRNDARGFGPGALFAVDVQGSFNTLDVRIADIVQRRLRGLAFREGARENRASYALDGVLLQVLHDRGTGNRADRRT